MANITITRGTTLPDSSAKSDFHGLVDNASATISSIENADISNSAAIAASKLNLATVAQDIAMSGKVINFAQGADVASATTTDIGATTGNFVNITGTTTITGLGTVQAGTVRFVKFGGILTLTHNATSLFLPNAGSNITTAANDTAVFVSLGSGNWRCLAFQPAAGVSYTPSTSNALSGSVIQTVNAQITTPVNVTTVPPQDDTNPLYQEGDVLGSLSITPTNASNNLLIRMSGWGTPTSTEKFTFWINDATATDPALAVRQVTPGGGAVVNATDFSIELYISAGDTNARTYYFVGGVSAGTFYFGRGDGGADLFGTAPFGSITIQEIKA